MVKKALLAEDHGIVIKGIRIIFETEFPGCSLDIVSNAHDLMSSLRTGSYELLILDLRLEDGDVMHLVADIRKLYPTLLILIFSANPEEIFARQLYKEGVVGYLSKQMTDREIIAALNDVFEGKIYMSERFKQLLLISGGTAAVNPLTLLTQRELHVANLMQAGMRPSDICRELNLQSSTVSTYKQKIFTKLNVSNVLELKQLFNNNNSIL